MIKSPGAERESVLKPDGGLSVLKLYESLKFTLIWLLLPALALLLMSYLLLSFSNLSTGSYKLPVSEFTFSSVCASPGGERVIVTARNSKTDSTYLLLSDNGGKDWKEVPCPYRIARITMDWKTGVGAAISDIGGDENYILKLEEYGQRISKGHASSFYEEYNDINIDWKTGRGLLAGKQNYYTLNFGKTWIPILINNMPSEMSGLRICMDWEGNRGFISSANLEMISTIDFKTWIADGNKIGAAPYQTIFDVNQNWKSKIGVATGFNYFDASRFMQQQVQSSQEAFTPAGFYYTKDNGNAWSKGRLHKRYLWALYSCSVTDSGHVYLVGERGTLIFSKDLGATWNDFSFKDTSVTLMQLVLSKNRPQYLIGNSLPSQEGQFYKSSDGRSWERVLLYRSPQRPEWIGKAIRVTAVIIWAGLLVMIVLILWLYILNDRVNERKKEIREENSLVLMSDNPTDKDTIGIFGNTVKAITHLIRNPDSKPPITIALCGKWGSGKSSLMSQIRKELSNDERFVTLWFNVWHFQSEQHMLTTFFTSLMKTLEKNFSLRYRLTLFYHKLQALTPFNRIRFYVGVLIIFPPLLFLIAQLNPFRTSVLEPLRTIPILDEFCVGLEMVFHAFVNGSKGTTLFSVLTYLAGVALLKKEWLPSGVSALFEIIPLKKFKVDIKNEDPDLREKYKKEFWEIMRAAGNEKRYVVFLDDVDRIGGDKIKQMLETINFITDTASKPPEWKDVHSNMFFVLGMSLTHVLENLGAEINNQTVQTDKDNITQGALYIEKMVDLVVEVPDFSGTVSPSINNLTVRS